MGHCISAIIFKQEDVVADFKYCKLNNGLGMLPEEEENEIAKMSQRIGNRPFITVFTDYFGGVGEQGSTFYKDSDSEGQELSSINEGLRMLSVEKGTNMDEFDTVGLGSYRSNHDMLEEMGVKQEEPIHKEKTVADLVKHLLTLPQDAVVSYGNDRHRNKYHDSMCVNVDMNEHTQSDLSKDKANVVLWFSE